MPFRDLPGVIQCRFKRGDYLIRSGERVEYIYYLLQGTVYRESVTATGTETILSSKISGNIVQSLVGILILYRRPYEGISNNDFIAHTNCVCYRIPVDVCMEYLRRHPALLEDVVRVSMDEYMHLMALFRPKETAVLQGGFAAYCWSGPVKQSRACWYRKSSPTWKCQNSFLCIR